MKPLTLTALGLSGKDWITRLGKADYRISSYAKDLILTDDFEKARTKKGKKFSIVFVKVADLGKTSVTTQELKDYAKRKGYELPTPEIALLLRETLTDEAIEEMGIWYVAALHDPIKDSDGDPRVLRVRRGGGGRWVNAGWGGPGGLWDGLGAFAFLLPASAETLSPPHSDSLPLELPLELTINGYIYKRA